MCFSFYSNRKGLLWLHTYIRLHFKNTEETLSHLNIFFKRSLIFSPLPAIIEFCHEFITQKVVEVHDLRPSLLVADEIFVFKMNYD